MRVRELTGRVEERAAQVLQQPEAVAARGNASALPGDARVEVVKAARASVARGRAGSP